MRKAALCVAVLVWAAAPLVAQGIKVVGKGGVQLKVDPLADKAGDDEATRKIKELLRTKKVSFDFVDTPFQDALSFIRALLNVNLVIDPKINTKQTLTLTVKDMNVGAALQWMLRLGGAAMEVRDGAVYVAPDAQKKPGVVKRPKGYPQAYRYRRMIGKAQIKVGKVADVELYLYEDDVPPETREMLLKLLKARLEAELAKLAADKAPNPKK
ncbi:hypothetical protein ACFL09_01110 [Planctomycetota bacterium]